MTEAEHNKEGGFYMMPRQLFADGCPLSLEARVLYTLILDRMKLSLANKWRDKFNRVYIYYTVSEAAKMLTCGESKAGHVFSELENLGYIIRRQQGLGKPSMIYLVQSTFPLLDRPRKPAPQPDEDDDWDRPF